jgi:Nif-specific regulatory protein
MTTKEEKKEGSESRIDLLQLATSLARLAHPDQACDELLELTTKAFDADSGQIILCNVGSGRLQVRATSPSLEKSEQTFSDTVLKEALRYDQPLCIADAKQHPYYRRAESVMGVESLFLSVLVVPMHGEDGQPLGALYLQKRSGERGFFSSEEDLALLQRLMDTLTPILWEKEQHHFFNGIRANRVKAAIEEMGFLTGPSLLMQRQVYGRIEKYAESDLTVCIQGETGTGKEVFAYAIHKLSRRSNGPFVRVRCNAIPSGLAESEFFGHMRGAFAQAYNDRPGQFEVADTGTVLLDEIGKLPLEIQAKLLHVLEKGRSDRVSFRRVGGVREISVDVRVIVASNRDLKELVAEGVFLEDLFYRVNQLPLYIPPLRERSDDIGSLARGFLEEANKQQEKRVRFSEAAIEGLLRPDWRGNVRELRDCIHRAVVLKEGSQVLESDEILSGPGGRPPEEIQADDDGVQADVPFRDLSKRQKKAAVRRAIAKYGNARVAAEKLGVSHQTIYNYLEDAVSGVG